MCQAEDTCGPADAGSRAPSETQSQAASGALKSGTGGRQGELGSTARTGHDEKCFTNRSKLGGTAGEQQQPEGIKTHAPHSPLAELGPI